MNKLVSFKKFVKKADKQSGLSNTSVIMDKNNVPLGFVLARDSFISLCTVIDEEFEKKVNNPKKAYDNIAGRLIDIIEERLPVNPKFARDLKSSIREAKNTRWIPLEEVASSLNV